MARVAVVTGGTRGIGAAISKALKAAGHKVAATYGGNDEAANKFKSDTGIAVYKWDVADAKSCADGLAKVAADLGPVEILVNNAGITKDGVFHRMSWDNWSAVIRTNLDSMFTMTRPLIEGMRERNFGRIINISSINALAQENAAKGIAVNCICPGYIATDMVAAMPADALKKVVAQIPIGRLGEVDEIADLVVYLASDKAGFFSGSVLTVNGGQYIANG
jgi:acetoacetyl-CoA reductase